MPDTPVDEIAVLRSTNGELLAKLKDRKTKLAEAEASVADLTTRVSTAEAALRTATIDRPLRAMAETISPTPSIWMQEFSKHFKVELRGDKLQVLDLEGNPVKDGDAEIEFTAPALIKLLTGDIGNEALSSFAYITRGSLAAGAGASQGNRNGGIVGPERQQEKQSATSQFGLR
jgi:hypothetical protein